MSESDLSAFHVQRSLHPDGGYRQISMAIIDRPYRFLDTGVTPGETYYYRLEALDRSGKRELFGPLSVRFDATGRPALAQNRPNPFAGGHTVIPFFIPRAGDVTIRVLDLSGRQVRVLISEPREAGRQDAFWNGLNDQGRIVSAGVYVYELAAPGIHATRQLVKLH